jgi:hypothetical protein
MFPPVLNIEAGQFLVPNDEEIFRVLLFRGRGEIERPRDDDLLIDDDHLVMGNGVCSVDPYGDSRIHEKGNRGILLRSLALVQDDLHFDPSLMGAQQGLRNGSGGKGVRLDKNGSLGIVQRFGDRGGAVSIRGEIDFPRGECCLLCGPGNIRKGGRGGKDRDSKKKCDQTLQSGLLLRHRANSRNSLSGLRANEREEIISEFE